MTPKEKIKYVKDAIDEKVQISPKGPVYLRLWNIVASEDGPTLLSAREQWSIIQKLEEEKFIQNVQPDKDKHGVWFEMISHNESKREHPIIRGQTLEHIARHFGELIAGWKIELLLKDWGVPETLINRSGSKWWTVNEVLKHYAYSTEKKDHEMLFKIIGEILHPLMFGGDKKAAKTVAEDFNKYLEYDGLVAIYFDEDKKYEVWRKNRVDSEDAREALNQDLFAQEQEELTFLRLPENKEKISALRKAYQVFMNIAEVFCDNPSRPSHELNDAYVQTKKLITNAVRDLRLYASNVSDVERIHTIAYYFIPFNNLFTAEKEYTPEHLGIDLSGKKLDWDYIRPRMHATYGCIDELYRIVDGSDVLSTPNVQQILNDVSLLLSKTKEENKKRTETKQKASAPQISVQKIEITKIPPLKMQGEREDNMQKKKNTLKDKTIEFDEALPAILVNGKPCALPPAKNEACLSRVMFGRRIGEFVDWSVIYNEMTGIDKDVIGDENNKKSVRDTMSRLNKRVREIIGTDDELLSWGNKSIKRNY